VLDKNQPPSYIKGSNNPAEDLMNTTEHVTMLQGNVHVVKSKVRPIIYKDGTVHIPKDQIIEEKDLKNTIVYTGRSIAASLMSTPGYETLDKITQFAMGNTGAADPQAAPSPQDENLTGQYYIQNINQVSSPSSVSRMFTTVVEPGDATGDWNELALKTTSGVLWSRLTTNTQTKEPDIFLTFRWVIVF
jgi:hypothetical protein